jgi:SRSO17 transposase
VRRHIRTGELAFYRCHSSEVVPLRELVRVAGRRWAVEESFQAGKGLAGLDEHQVRRWTSWRRWTLLAMLAHALLAVGRPDRADLQRDPPTVQCVPLRILATGHC